jgi:hypothetical protein
MLIRTIVLAALAALGPLTASAQSRPAAPTAPRIYVFDNGAIKGLDPQLFNSRARSSRKSTSSTSRT